MKVLSIGLITSGYSLVEHGILELAAVVIDEQKNVLETFNNASMKLLEGQKYDQQYKNNALTKNKNKIMDIMANGSDPKDIITAFHEWVDWCFTKYNDVHIVYDSRLVKIDMLSLYLCKYGYPPLNHIKKDGKIFNRKLIDTSTYHCGLFRINPDQWLTDVIYKNYNININHGVKYDSFEIAHFIAQRHIMALSWKSHQTMLTSKQFPQKTIVLKRSNVHH
uniref:Uncharacterized protein n=1 Tax=viral metagenome TaxID=1070528 RepID=A0A6C0CLA5_9ZZZZ